MEKTDNGKEVKIVYTVGRNHNELTTTSLWKGFDPDNKICIEKIVKELNFETKEENFEKSLIKIIFLFFVFVGLKLCIFWVPFFVWDHSFRLIPLILCGIHIALLIFFGIFFCFKKNREWICTSKGKGFSTKRIKKGTLDGYLTRYSNTILNVLGDKNCIFYWEFEEKQIRNFLPGTKAGGGLKAEAINWTEGGIVFIQDPLPSSMKYGVKKIGFFRNFEKPGNPGNQPLPKPTILPKQAIRKSTALSMEVINEFVVEQKHLPTPKNILPKSFNNFEDEDHQSPLAEVNISMNNTMGFECVSPEIKEIKPFQPPISYSKPPLPPGKKHNKMVAKPRPVIQKILMRPENRKLHTNYPHTINF